MTAALGSPQRSDTPQPPATLVVIAKSPRPGRSKTRLHGRFTPQEAASLAEACVADTLAAVAATPARRRVVVLDGEPGPWLPDGFEVVTQRGRGLDERLAAAFADVLDTGDEGPALLVGMDTPQLTPADLEVDFAGHDALLGPATDGGFWALGLRRSIPEALLGVPMSVASTGQDQLARLRSLGLHVGLLPTLRDVDTPEDAEAVAAVAPHSRFARRHRRLTRGARAGTHPIEMFEAALTGQAVHACDATGTRPLDVDAWTGHADPVDETLLDRVEPPVLDLGCGPGRLVGALAGRGMEALGIDVSALAVQMTGDRGAVALRRRLEDRLPAEGSWGTVVLADGNIGIGGDPLALLHRCAALLRPGGIVLVEADGHDGTDLRDAVVLRDDAGRASWPLPWARVGAHPLRRLARTAGFTVEDQWRAHGRVLLALRLG